MLNALADLSVVNYKGSGAVSVWKMLGGKLVDPIQDGEDVGNGSPPGLEVIANGTNNNNHANRLLDAFNSRFLLHGYRIYDRNVPTDGKWANVDGNAQDATGVNHSGLHKLYPNGIETLAFLFVVSDVLHVMSSTDGVVWVDTNTGLALGTFAAVGHSIVFRNLIFWFYRGSDGNEVRSYDFVLNNAVEYNLPGLDPFNNASQMWHVHQNTLFIIGHVSGQDPHLFRFDGSVFTDVGEILNGDVSQDATYGMWSDGDDLLTAWVVQSGNTKRCQRLSDVLLGGSMVVNDADVILSGIVGATSPSGFIPIVMIHPDPSVFSQRAYLWHRNGDTQTGTFNPNLVNYRQILTGAHTTPFSLGEIVTGGTSGAVAVVTDIADNSSLSFTNVNGVFQNAEALNGSFGGSTTSAGLLVDVAATPQGTGLLASNYGLPCVTDGGLDRIPANPNPRPSWVGIPREILNDRTRYFFNISGDIGLNINLAMVFSAQSEAPDTPMTLAAGTISLVDEPVTNGLIGNLFETQIEALTPTTGDAYVVSLVDGDGTLNPGAILIGVGDIVEFDGVNWTFVHDATSGFPDKTIHATLSTTEALIAPYTDGPDNGKVVAFDGTSLTGLVLDTPTNNTSTILGITPSNSLSTWSIDVESGIDDITKGDRITVVMDIA